jgi:hypothetical protein
MGMPAVTEATLNLLIGHRFDEKPHKYVNFSCTAA